MDRKEKLLHHIDTGGCGLEIGPSHQPVAPKKEGYDVEILDHQTQEELRIKYREHGVDLDAIEPVDYVWRGEPYAELTGKPTHYDWVIASHIIEHAPDLIGFLLNCDGILKEDGVLSLAVPDKRYCFDHHRPVTGLAKVIDSHVQKHTIHTPGTVVEYALNVVSKNGNIAWHDGAPGGYQFVHSLEYARLGMRTVMEQKQYLDVHAWCFVPSALRLLIHDLYILEFIPFQEVCFFPTEGHEFYLTLGRKGDGMPGSRMEMLEAVERELAADLSQ